MNRIQKLMDSSECFASLLNRIKKCRTLVLKIAFPIVIVEDILTGKKPHELLPPEQVSVLAIVGAILVVAGAFIRFWARGHFVKGSLFTTGPYALVRHPLYLGSFLIVAGVLFQLSDWLNWVVIIPLFVLFYGAAIVYEESSMEKRFGRQWQFYKSKVPAIIPSLRTGLFWKNSYKWNWQLFRNTGELFTFLMTLTLPLLIELLEYLAFEQFPHL